MSQTTWKDVDRFIVETLLRPDADLEHALRASAAAGLPEIQVSPAQGQLLQLLALAVGARRILEIGAEQRVTATIIQTVGVKGYDGFALLRVKGPAR